MGELNKRILVGVCIGPLVAALFYFLPLKWFFLFLSLLSILAVHESIVMAGVREKYLLLFLAAISLLPLYQRTYHTYALWLLSGPAIYMIAKFLRGDAEKDSVNREIIAGVNVLLLTEVFVVLPVFYIFLLKERGPYLPLILLLTLWASDTCAYLFGKAFGRNPLVIRISPKKTYEGLLGAILGSMLVIALSAKVMEIGLMESLVLGAIMGILAQTGDILESAAKRDCAVKDSSALIPGHGGVLDRLDSFIFAGPFLYHYLAGMKA